MFRKIIFSSVLFIFFFTASIYSQWFWKSPLPQGNTLNGVCFIDANTGTAVGNSGTIIRTTDGGQNWNIQFSGTMNRLNGVSFTDANNGIVVGYGGTILRTTDGGDNWVSQISNTADPLLGVSFTDVNNGTAAGESEHGQSRRRRSRRAGRTTARKTRGNQ